MRCLFCSGAIKNFRPQAGNDFICSRCVQILLGADQRDLKKAYTKAIACGYPDKARAVETFLDTEENINGQRKPVSKQRGRHINRKRVVRAIGDKEKRIGRSKVPAQASVLQNFQYQQDLSC